MLKIGLSITSLQRKLGAVRNPTLAAFNEKIEGFDQARRTTSSTTFGNAVSRNPSSTNSSRHNSGQVQLLVPTLLMVGENETNASFCAANVSGVL